MAVTATITHKISCSGWVQSGAKGHDGDGWTHREVSIGASDSDKLVNIAIDVSQIRALYFAVEESELLLETNNSSSGACDDSIELIENIPLIWDNEGGYYTCPLGTDVTAIYVTNTGGVAATLYIGVCEDATP